MKITNNQMAISHPIIINANSIADQHSQYVDQFVSRGNTMLYQILADILKVHEQLEACDIKERVVKEMRQHLREVHNIKTQTNTKTTALVTKYVTRASRKTAHVYSRVLEVAIANGIKSSGLVKFIKQSGGIDKVRMSVASAEVAKQHRDQQRSLLQAMRGSLAQQQGLATVSFGAARHSLPCAKDVTFNHLLCQFNHTTQQHEVVAVLYPSSTLEDMAMDHYAIMLSVAAGSDDDVEFRAQCKQQGLNMDLIHRWMRANNIADAAAAKAMALNAARSAQSPLAANSDRNWLKAA